MLFKTLTPEETHAFEQYARDNDPPDLANWTLYHPVCRAVWTARGIGPDVGAAPLRTEG